MFADTSVVDDVLRCKETWVSTHEEGPQAPGRHFEHLVGHKLAQMALQILRGSFAVQSWRHSQEAAQLFVNIAQLVRDETNEQDIRNCFEEAAKALRATDLNDDAWAKAAAAGTRYHVENLARHGHAFGRREDRRNDFIREARLAEDGPEGPVTR